MNLEGHFPFLNRLWNELHLRNRLLRISVTQDVCVTPIDICAKDVQRSGKASRIDTGLVIEYDISANAMISGEARNHEYHEISIGNRFDERIALCLLETAVIQ